MAIAGTDEYCYKPNRFLIMLFNSYEFLFVFFPSFFLFYFLTPSKYKNLTLTIGNYVFYAAWKTEGVLILLGITIINFYFGTAIYKCKKLKNAQFMCALSVFTNVGILCFFKYIGLFENTINFIFNKELIRTTDIILPIGISFFIFQCISYTVAIYKKDVVPTRNFIDFACYVSLFPHLIAGPILRYSIMAPQLVKKEISLSNTADGIVFFIIGLGKKVLLADTMAVAANALFDGGSGGIYSCWAGLIAYSLQIFFDFSAYSDMAVGLGKMLGFKIPQNFDSPYLSASFSEFWRRWHISLSTWLRDFLYIPLGGNRISGLRTYFNISITMLIGGLWHGASWTFVVWGGYHGLLLSIERLLGKRNPIKRLPRVAQIIFTNFMVMLGWAFFRADTFKSATKFIAGLFGGFSADAISPVLLDPGVILIFFICTLLIATGFENIFRHKLNINLVSTILIFALFIVCAALLVARQSSPFIYAQF